LLAEGALSSAFVPIFTEYLTHSREKACRFASNTLNLALLFFPVLSGCISLKKGYPDKHFFVLDLTHPPVTNPPARPNRVLQISPFQISPRYEGQEFVYRTGELRYESDFYNQFFIPPAVIITEEFTRWLAASGLFDRVTNPSDMASPTQILNGSITAIYGDYTEKRPKAILEIQILIHPVSESKGPAYFQRNYRQEIPLKDPSAEALAAGWDEALRAILADLENDLR
ncbi:membrane integrity-associated transporter subunit PqiC, partial [Candidatus Sumerlaeota bacterium]|nr:membrane integrity-associated transporter subunit PqiC [Candidatus Sumerlaeota bacterium]